MKYKAVIFDFNGTLFWDTEYHNLAWDEFFKKRDIVLSDAEKMQKMHGKPNKEILKSILNKEFTDSEYLELSEEKEEIYQQICKNNKCEYAPGAVNFINFLKNNQINYVIATSSGPGNINFYIENMDLTKLIDSEFIIYDDGSFKGKPNPDMFLKAIEKLGYLPEEVVIFEDSMAGIKAAENAKAGKIIIVNSNNEDYNDFVYQQIASFDEVEKEIFI